jgi:DnaJ-class molecular chaperone
VNTATLPSYPHTLTHEIAYVRADGSRGACMSSDSACASTTAYYADKGYRIDYVSTHATCNACDGRGKRQSKRSRLPGVTVKCEACKGEGQRTIVADGPACGCSACRQNWIETGETRCVANDGDIIANKEGN